MPYFSLTVKSNNPSPTIENYEAWLANARKYVKIKNVFYERDSRNVLHFHALIESSKGVYYKKLMYKQYHQHIAPLITDDDLSRWHDYCVKDQVKKK